MHTLVGGTGIIGQDMVCGFGNGKYTQFEGTEISIENCLKAKVKDLIVQGKTYQNLFKAKLNQGHADSKLTSQKDSRVNSEGFLLREKIYTISISDENYKVLVYPNYVDSASAYKPWSNKIVWNNNLETNNIRIMVKKTDNSNITVNEVLGKIILLEGDYTDTPLPQNINGIESVAEKENNILGLKVNDVVSNISLPIPLRSLPNGVADTIEGDKVVQRVGKVVLEDISGYNIANQIETDQRIGIMIEGSLNSLIRNPIISNNFYYISVGLGIRGAFNYGERIFLYLGLNTLEEYKEWFENNPTTFYYELETPIIHNISIPQLSTVKGTNIINCDNNIKPNLKLKVKVK